jgi:hypothetical protein
MKGAYYFCLAILLTSCAHARVCSVRLLSGPRDINASIAETERYLLGLQNKTNIPAALQVRRGSGPI